MYISTEIGSMKKYGNPKEIISLLKEVGFDAYDFSMDTYDTDNVFIYSDNYIEQAKDLRKYADEIGIVCNQAHAPFPTAKIDDIKYNEYILKMIKRSIEVASILGAKIIVVHPANYYSDKENKIIFDELLPFAKSLNIKIALENMWAWNKEEDHASICSCSNEERFNSLIDLIDDDYIVSCIDVGHSEMYGLNTSFEKMSSSVKKFECIHIHDNDKIRDHHMLPFSYSIDFENVIESLKKCNYKGDITFEAITYLKKAPKDLLPSFLKLMLDVGKYIKNKLEF